jgi:polyphosphate kinase
VGRFLEHSRLFWFQGGGTPRVFIGSADLMERNLDRRVEVLCPITDPALAADIHDVVLSALLRDNSRAHALTSDGRYEPVEPEEGDPAVDAQHELLTWYSRPTLPEESLAHE